MTKRFTLRCEKLGKYWNMGIADSQTKEPFDESLYEFHPTSFQDSKDEMEDLCQLLNELNDENEQLKQQLMENTCDNCIYSKAIYADVECRKKGLTEWKMNCDEFKGDVE